MKRINLLILFMVPVALTGCASSSSYSMLEGESVQPGAVSSLYIPAGVDSAAAADAEILAEASFVPYEKEVQAERMRSNAVSYRVASDTLWYYLSLDRSNFEVTEEDSIDAIRTFNRGVEFVQEMQQLGSRTNIPEDQLRTRHAQLVDQAVNALEEAIVLNPFDVDTRYLLAQLYGVKAVRLTGENEHRKAIEVLERLERIEKGDHPIYASLAENYFAIGNYTRAAENFSKAENTLRETGRLSDTYFETGEYSPNDLAALFLYAYYAGEAYTFNYDAPNALSAFERARQFTEDDSEKQAVASMVDFINWDNGNIKASMARDSLITLDRDGNLEGAERGFIALMRDLGTQKAKDETDWRLAIVQYRLEKEDSAADRLMNLVNRTEKGIDGLPLDESYQRYFNDYGLICYNIGQRYLSERDRATALKYLEQSSRIQWSDRARANIEIAGILMNNLPEALRYASMAEEEISSLGPEDRKELYRLLSDLHRRNGNMPMASRYRELWSQI